MRKWRRSLVIAFSMVAVLLAADLLARGPLLRRVVHRGDVPGVRFALRLGANPNAWNPRAEHPPLADAAFAGRLEILRLLLDHGADVNARNEGGQTALHGAAGGGNVEIVRVLLKRGARVDIKDLDHKTTPLGFALDSNATNQQRREIVRLLIEHGADPNLSVDPAGGFPLDWAEEDGDPELAAYLRAHGAKHAPPMKRPEGR